MKHLTNLTFVLAIIIFAALGVHCGKEKTLAGPREGPPATLVGSWSWQKSVGGIAGVTLTPQSTGHTQGLVFRSYGICERYRDDTLIVAGQYSIAREKTWAFPDTVAVIYYQNNWQEPQATQIRGDTLELVDLCIDCFGHTYVRVR